MKALAFNQDRCCNLAICLQLILFHQGRVTGSGDVLPIGLFLETHYDFYWQDEVTQTIGDILFYFLLKQFFANA
jgi:hypothetical protein